MDYIRTQRLVSSLKELFLRCKGDSRVGDECCRLLLRLIARSWEWVVV